MAWILAGRTRSRSCCAAIERIERRAAVSRSCNQQPSAIGLNQCQRLARRQRNPLQQLKPWLVPARCSHPGNQPSGPAPDRRIAPGISIRLLQFPLPFHLFFGHCRSAGHLILLCTCLVLVSRQSVSIRRGRFTPAASVAPRFEPRSPQIRSRPVAPRRPPAANPLRCSIRTR